MNQTTVSSLRHGLSEEGRRSVSPDEGFPADPVADHVSNEGTIVLWDIEDPGTEDDIVGSSFSLFFYLTSGTACYSRQEIGGWLENAGFGDIQVQNPPGGSTHMLITGRKG